MSASLFVDLADMLAASLPRKAVDMMLEDYIDNERAFFSTEHRLSALGGGRFCESLSAGLAVYVFGEEAGKLVGIQNRCDWLTDLKKTASKLSGAAHPLEPKALRQLAQTIRVIHGIRSERDVAHAVDGFDQAIQESDARFVLSATRWCMGEVLRLFIDDDKRPRAAEILRHLIRYEVPHIEVFEGQRHLLKANLSNRDAVLLMLFAGGEHGLSRGELIVGTSVDRRRIGEALTKLATEKMVFESKDTGRYTLSTKGIACVRDTIFPTLTHP